jgi:hypothetical protein
VGVRQPERLGDERWDRVVFLALLGLGLAGLVIGWSLFWFLTDDAYIAFRYVENSIRGFGYVWNPPPFRPVEGYTSFLWAVTFAVLLLEWLERQHRNPFSWRGVGTLAAVCSPLAVVLLHFGWRRGFYGEWLPNTYHAKVVGAWPYSGALYAFSFLVEFCLWPILGLVAVAVIKATRESIDRSLREGLTSLASGLLLRRLPILATLTALSVHFVYFTLIVGGDHFEYRVYNHLFPLAFLSLIWALRRLRLRPYAVLLAALFSVS